MRWGSAMTRSSGNPHAVTRVEGREMDCRGSYRLPDILEDIEFRRCTVRTCQNPARQTIDERPVVRHVSLVRCHIVASTAGPVIAEDCTIDTIRFHRGIWGAQILPGWAFRHVVVRGNVTGSIALVPGPGWNPGPHGPALDDPFVVANAAYYEGVDWALDISEARFTDIVLGSGIPARLIRRDPATQVVITRAALADGRWRDLVADAGGMSVGFERFLVTEFEDTVIVAGTRGRYLAKQLAAFDRLRDAGIIRD